ncbi:MAG: phospholipid/cholesterol/gamma-HCH transport system substrate-binding protein [Cellvibrionaceae bacterium]|jgi:phospholipid/cholesterol/gamma-HCH transport system substrate-binding protein
MNRKAIDFWVGMFVLLGIIALVFLALRVANQATLSSGSSYPVVTYFTNIGGLKIRSPVKSAGVIVGRVTDIQLDPSNYQARVTLSLDDQYQFSTDSSASVLTSGLLGDQYVGLEPGGEMDFLKAGDTIQYSSSALVLESLIGKILLSSPSARSNPDNIAPSKVAPSQ